MREEINKGNDSSGLEFLGRMQKLKSLLTKPLIPFLTRNICSSELWEFFEMYVNCSLHCQVKS